MPRRTVVLRSRDIGGQNRRIVLTGSLTLRSFLRWLRIGNKFHQRAVRIAEVHACAGALGAETLHRSSFDGNAAVLEMPHCVGDRSIPLEAQVAVAGGDRQPRHLGGGDSWSVHVELPIAEAISKAHGARDQLGAQDAGVEGIRTHPVGDMDDAMIERYRQRHCLTPSAASAVRARVPMSASSRYRVYRKASCRGPRRARPWRGLFR